MQVPLPGGGTVRLPPPQELAFFGGLAFLAAVEVIEWPIAAVLGLGHLLAEDHHHRLIRALGEALEEA
jgi:hypothetical protein